MPSSVRTRPAPPVAVDLDRRRRRYGLALSLALLGALVATVALGSVFSGGSRTTPTAAAIPTAAARSGQGGTQAAAPAPGTPDAESAPPAAAAQPPTTAAPPAAPPAAAQPPAPAAADVPTQVVRARAPAPSAAFAGLARGVATVDVGTWQKQMVDRGWPLRVDGIFGPESAQATRAFQAQKGLPVDGIVGVDTWNAAWTMPVT